VSGPEAPTLAPTRERLLSAAHALIEEGGYGAAPVSAIARGAGVAAGTLYRHFASKEELFVEVFRAVGDREIDAMRVAARAPVNSELERLLLVLATFANSPDILADFGIECRLLRRHQHAVGHCVDWSEQRHDLSGPVGAAIASRMRALGWNRPGAIPRSLLVTPEGRSGLADLFSASLAPNSEITVFPWRESDGDGTTVESHEKLTLILAAVRVVFAVAVVVIATAVRDVRTAVEALKRAGLRALRFHDLRHTFGTRMIAKADIRRVQEWMGHADIQTTMRYLHYTPREGDAALVAEALAAEEPAPVEDCP